MTSPPTLTQTLDKALKYAVEKKNFELVQTVFAQGNPTNITECLNLAMENQATEIVQILLQKMTPTPAPTLVPALVPAQKKKHGHW